MPVLVHVLIVIDTCGIDERQISPSTTQDGPILHANVLEPAMDVHGIWAGVPMDHLMVVSGCSDRTDDAGGSDVLANRWRIATVGTAPRRVLLVRFLGFAFDLALDHLCAGHRATRHRAGTAVIEVGSGDLTLPTVRDAQMVERWEMYWVVEMRKVGNLKMQQKPWSGGKWSLTRKAITSWLQAEGGDMLEY